MQDLALDAQQSSLCVKHTEVSWEAPGGFVKVLLADCYKYAVSSEKKKRYIKY